MEITIAARGTESLSHCTMPEGSWRLGGEMKRLILLYIIPFLLGWAPQITFSHPLLNYYIAGEYIKKLLITMGTKCNLSMPGQNTVLIPA